MADIVDAVLPFHSHLTESFRVQRYEHRYEPLSESGECMKEKE